MNRFVAFLCVVFSTMALIFLASIFTDDYYVSSINGKALGEVPSRKVVLYEKEGTFVIKENGSVNFYEPTLLRCTSRTQQPFSLGELVSDSAGELKTVEVSGYMEMKGKTVDCGFKSLTERPVAYSIFMGQVASALMYFGILCSIIFLILMMSVSVALLVNGRLK